MNKATTKSNNELAVNLVLKPSNLTLEDFLKEFSYENSRAILVTQKNEFDREFYFLPRIHNPRYKNDLYEQIVKKTKGQILQAYKDNSINEFNLGNIVDKKLFSEVFLLLLKKEFSEKIKDNKTINNNKRIKELETKIEELSSNKTIFPFSEFVKELGVSHKNCSDGYNLSYAIQIGIKENNDDNKPSDYLKLYKKAELVPNNIFKESEQIIVHLHFNKYTLEFDKINFDAKIPSQYTYWLTSKEVSGRTHNIDSYCIDIITSYIAHNNAYNFESEDGKYQFIHYDPSQERVNFSEEKKFNPVEGLQHFYKIWKKSCEFVQKEINQEKEKRKKKVKNLLEE